MAKEQELVQVRIYPKDRDILRRFAIRKSRGRSRIMSHADVIHLMIKGV
jgi:hypothetical protein